MAKLSARGRKELVRVQKLHLDGDVRFSRTTLTLMSDGVILRKHDWKRVGACRSESTGWTVQTRIKLTEAGVRAFYRQGYDFVSGLGEEELVKAVTQEQ